MSKLVLLYKHVRPIGVHIPGRGISYPKASMDTFPSPIDGRPAAGMNIDLDAMLHVELLPEEPDPLPKSLAKDADPEFLREYKLSQARTIAANIKQNEALVRSLQSHEDAGNIKIFGRGRLDSKGNIIPDQDAQATIDSLKPQPQPEQDPDLVISPQPVAAKRGRKPKE